MLTIFAFDGDKSDLIWRVVNDDVMGGVSTSTISYDDGIMTFTGNVSLENNGGFASCRTIPFSLDLSDYTHFTLKVKGDGQRYGFRLWTSSRWDGVSYAQNFETEEGEWQEINLPLKAFYPQFRGYRLKDYPQLDPSNIRQLGILIGDKQKGAFKIEVDYIKAANLPD